MSLIVADKPAEGVVRITFNAPETRNAFTFEMYDQLMVELNKVREDLDTRVVILTGTGKGFCSGHNLSSKPTADWWPPEWGMAQGGLRASARISQVPITVRQLPQPVIAAVNGAAAGLGYALALASDICIAAKSAKFVNAFYNSGCGAEMGFSWLLPRAVGIQRAAELLYSGRPVGAEEAERIGLCLKAVEDDKLMDAALEIADSIAQHSPMAVMLTKQTFQMNLETANYQSAVRIESRAVFMMQGTEDVVERRNAVREKRRPKYKNR